MAGKIPLKLQIAIRDLWNKETAPVQVARANLHKVLGCAVTINPEWIQLLGDLDKVYPDKQSLATAVAGCVELWCKVFAELLEGVEDADTAQQEWAETLMDRLQPLNGLRLLVTVTGSDASLPVVKEPGTAWSDDRSSFLLYLPHSRPVTVPGEFAAVYRGGLLTCFKEKEPAGPSLAVRSAAAAGGSGDDWADVAMDAATGKAGVVETATGAEVAIPKLEYLPSLESLPRPDELFLRPPYHIIVADYGKKKIVVQGSHSPSLKLLGEYMKRWCRINHHDSRQPPAVAVEFNQSCWGTSPMHDQVTLTSEANNIFQFNPAIVLAFIEGVLGYDKVSTEQGIWTFRRTVPFKG
ncbi:uncharacterized protein SPSK_10412 [Sporothrix schenckii 1099-18]|uniref:Uncharacterized protein n=1 Tax=Sporothrix schenckii 1099-18 TaxID=1397361 RepID=A0A0F2MEC3_SPOSC|nr:uncharacterized protein SPSK_10412 [Sporothrix schenckii 1099-18]KJR87434.1 hypothetical protein SPSK_10412 [Sporothrix schenckii 1099-18]